MHTSIVSSLFFVLFALALLVGVDAATTRYVSPTGSDSNNGLSVSTAYGTIGKAASMSQAGDTVEVQDGTYNVNSGSADGIAITTNCVGTSSAPILFKSKTRWGSKIIDSGLGITWKTNGAYTIVDGFEITGKSRLGIYYGANANYGEVRNCYVHDLLCTGGVGGSGGAAIDGINSYMYVHHNRVQNMDIAKYTGSSTVQGIYIAGTNWRVTNNIIGGVAADGISNWHGATTNTITNNTIFNCGSGVLIGQGDSGAVIPPGSHDNYVAYNVMYKNRGGMVEYCYDGQQCIGVNNRYVYNCLYNNTANWGRLYGTGQDKTGNQIVDPQFKNFQLDGSGDYTLKSTSPVSTWGAGWTWIVSTTSVTPPTTTPPPVTILGTLRYVSTTGSDSNNGLTVSTAYKTIGKAASVAQPGDVIQVQNGVYNVNSGSANTAAIATSCAGTSTKRITFQAQTKWGVKIVDSGLGITWRHSGIYTVIDGFRITGTSRIGIYFTVGYGEIKNNWVHDLTCKGGTGGAGGAGIDGIGSYMYVHHNRVQNMDIAKYTGSSTVQGIYIAGTNWKVTNNIVSGVAADGISNWHGATTNTITNNTIFNCGSGVLLGQGDSGAVIPPGSHHNYVAYNIMYKNRQGMVEYCYTGIKCMGVNNRYVYNDVYGNGKDWYTVYGTGQTITGNMAVEPQFNNYLADGSGDYSLKSTSPVKNWGAGWTWVVSVARGDVAPDQQDDFTFEFPETDATAEQTADSQSVNNPSTVDGGADVVTSTYDEPPPAARPNAASSSILGSEESESGTATSDASSINNNNNSSINFVSIIAVFVAAVVTLIV